MVKGWHIFLIDGQDRVVGGGTRKDQSNREDALKFYVRLSSRLYSSWKKKYMHKIVPTWINRYTNF